MPVSNKDEYHIIRQEMDRIKNCSTTYLGWILGGFGASVSVYAGLSGLLLRYASSEDTGARTHSNNLLIGIAFLLLAVTVSLVLYVLLYKFNSHNRYAGYCKLLNQEDLSGINFPAADTSTFEVMSWESCVDKLRESGFDQKAITDAIGNLKSEHVISDADIESHLGRVGLDEIALDRNKLRGGLGLLFQRKSNPNAAQSWQFPLHVVRLFLVICLIYFCLAVYEIYEAYEHAPSSPALGKWTVIVPCVVIIVPLVSLWIAFLGQLHCLMQGSSTVGAYCWRFLPFRFAYLIKRFGKIHYSLTRL